MRNPFARTKTRRRDLATKAKRSLTKYGNILDWPNTDDDPNAHAMRVRELLWAQAHIQRALYLETGGAVGDQYATAKAALLASTQDRTAFDTVLADLFPTTANTGPSMQAQP